MYFLHFARDLYDCPCSCFCHISYFLLHLETESNTEISEVLTFVVCTDSTETKLKLDAFSFFTQ